MSLRSSLSRVQELVGDPRERAHYDHGLRSDSALHDANKPSNGGSILHRRAPELHHHHVVASLKSALSL
jgi:hypothetical protein